MTQENKKRLIAGYILANTKNPIIVAALKIAVNEELPNGKKFTAVIFEKMPEPADDGMFLAEGPETDARREMIDLEIKIDAVTAAQLQVENLPSADYGDGWRAFLAGVSVHESNHRSVSLELKQWIAGWYAAREDSFGSLFDVKKIYATGDQV
jgi:hypothetical protein